MAHSQIPFEYANVPAYPKKSIYNTLTYEQMVPIKPTVSSYMLTAVAYYKMEKKYDMVFQEHFLSMSSCKLCMVNGKKYSMPELYTLNEPGFTVASNILNIS